MSYEEWAATLFPFEAKTLTRKEIFQAGAASRDVEMRLEVRYWTGKYWEPLYGARFHEVLNALDLTPNA